jgi:hypothetical protein
VQIALSQTDNRYARLGALNNAGTSYVVGWQGTFPFSLSSAASWSRSQSSASFADLRNTTAVDIITTEAGSFRLGHLPHPDWPVYVQFDNSSTSNSVTALAANDARTHGAEIGLHYTSPLGNQAGLLARRTDGYFPNRVVVAGNRYRQQDVAATVQWKPGIKSALNLRIGKTRRQPEDQPQFDFSGTTGNAGVDWGLTSMTSINATVGRDVTATGTQDLNFPSYALIRSYGMGARWAPTPKVSAEARIGSQARYFGGTLSDTTQSSSIVLLYAPIRPLQMSMQLRHDVRESSNALLPYSANVGMLNVTLSF